MKSLKQNKWYSTIISTLLVWFMLILTTWVFKLVMNTYFDTRGMLDSIKAFAWAEWALELSLLDLKEKWYGYQFDENSWVDFLDPFNKTLVLSEDPLDKSDFKYRRDVLVSYNIDSITDEVSGELESGEYKIVQLFYITDDGLQKATDITLNTENNVVWNIISNSSWLSNVWDIDSGTKGNKKWLENGSFNFEKEKVENFLYDTDNINNYIVLFNSGWASADYTLKAGNGEYFTKDITEIETTGQIWDYKQNLRINIDNTQFLNLLKYSVFDAN